MKAFNYADPFTLNGVFESVHIHQYLRRAPKVIDADAGPPNLISSGFSGR